MDVSRIRAIECVIPALLYSRGYCEAVELVLSSRRVCRAVLLVSDSSLDHALWLFKQSAWAVDLSLRPLDYQREETSGSEQTSDADQ